MYNYTYDNGRIEQAVESEITYNDYNTENRPLVSIVEKYLK